METSRTIGDAEMQRILFSDDPPLGELPVFEPIEYSQSSDDEETTQSLISLDPKTRAVEAACKAGNADRAFADVQHLLQTGTNPQDFQVCLIAAASSGQEGLAQMLLSAGVPASQWAVKAAIKQDSIPLLSLLIKNGWNINEEEAWCLPPLLSFAIHTKASESTIAWFLSNGADPNATCQMDVTPLSVAVAVARYSVVEQLFAHCPTTTVFRGQLLHHAAGRDVPEDCDMILRLVLRRCRPDINAIMYQDHYFSYEVHKIVGLGTALYEAARTGRLSTIKTLIAHGADISIRDSLGYTALDVAEREHNLPVIEELRRLEAAIA
ncbi:hypothetical protein DOTSEDRAFT_75051 [Dothistroma septosporum NZE10]|uniref:Uncharacterized protein n=1 Tax=Dothistroma septosporum (strain NZE10 / CBS 128990) TaxID=675120 RepID=M2XI73_DOTSN|nr:hypothetical protein DOTSEDRAFT_75051 [Dothistroma septosporum NZE10]